MWMMIADFDASVIFCTIKFFSILCHLFCNTRYQLLAICTSQKNEVEKNFFVGLEEETKESLTVKGLVGRLYPKQCINVRQLKL
jgi:hypothetical protein